MEQDITKLLKKMRKRDGETKYKLREDERIQGEHDKSIKKEEKAKLTDKQKYLRSLRNGWK